MDSRLYWVWLQMVLGPGSKKVREVLFQYVSLAQFQEIAATDQELSMLDLTAAERHRMMEITLEDAARLIEDQEKAGLTILTPDDPQYPKKLLQIYDLPAVLYVQGDLPKVDDRLSIAMVGTRKASPAAMELGRTISKDLASQNVVVVSGGAMGVDTAAHTGAMEGGGQTICVLGCGIGYNYLPKQKPMRQAVACCGAVVSEYPAGTPASPWNFPRRNRIITGLSDGTVVVEAGVKSGSLVTARISREQERPVFAAPPSIIGGDSAGTVSLLEKGAGTVVSARDILAAFGKKYQGDQRETDWYVACKFFPQPNLSPQFAAARARQDDPVEDWIEPDLPEGNDPPKDERPVPQAKAERNPAPAPVREDVKKPARRAERRSAQGSEAVPLSSLGLDQEMVQGAMDTVVAALGKATLTRDALLSKTKLPVPLLLAALTELETAGQICSYSGGRYSLV